MRSSVRRFWRTGKTGVSIFLLTFLVIAYAVIIAKYEVGQTWKQDIEDISTFIPVGGIIVGALIGGIELIMLLSDFLYDRKQRRITEAKAEGFAEGGAQFYAEIIKWNERRIEAEKDGKEFNEPIPTPQTIQVSTPVEKTTHDHSADDTIVK